MAPRIGPPGLTLVPFLLALAPLISPLHAADYHVPSGPTPTLQDAIDAALVSADPLETIYIDADLDVFTETTLPFGFNPGHRLLIRPGTTLLRARIRMNTCCDPVIHGVGTSSVTLQDLDIFRHITNGDHIVYYESCSEMLIQRCRIGSDWTVPGAQGYSAIYWHYPFNSMIRNTLTFATAPSTFRAGIEVMGHDDPGSRLWLYNNSVQGFYYAGLAVSGTAGEILVRNNVAVTEVAINPDPVGYYGNIGPGVFLAASHNAVFCDPGDEWGGFDDIRGANFSRLNFPDISTSFVTWTWTPGSPNPTFLGLSAGGPLHAPARYGQNLTGGIPEPGDQQVFDDWEREVRPSGVPLHTDRGADQADADALSSVASRESEAFPDIAVRPVPSRGLLEMQVHVSEGSERVSARLFDSSGRLAREVWRGKTTRGDWVSCDVRGLPAGVYYLAVSSGETARAKRVVLVP